MLGGILKTLPQVKKVCIVVSSAMTVSAFLQEPIRRLAEHNRVFLIANLKPGERPQGLPRSVRVFAVDIERRVKPLRDMRASLEMTRIFRQHRFDVVHSLTPKAGLLAMLAATAAGIRHRVHTFTGQVWATRRGLVRRVLRSVDRLIARLASQVLVDSPSQRDFLLRENVLLAERSGVLHQGSVSGVDLQRFKPLPSARVDVRIRLGIPAADTIFLFIGRLNNDKGVLELAKAFRLVFDQYPNAHLLIVGPDEGNVKSVMQKILMPCSDRVHFVGFSDKPEEFMAAADVLCLPSHREGFGNVVIEAAAVGIPALASRIYGLTDAVEDQKTGLLFNVGDVNALAAAMGLMAGDAGLREKLGKQARARVKRDFSSDKLGAAWVDFYRKLA